MELQEYYFSQLGDYRSFELVVEGESLFVNASSLAMISRFFASLCFDDFKEKKHQKATIGDEKFEDILVLISSIHPADIPMMLVNVHNLIVLAQLADKYMIKSLLKSCEFFVECEQFGYIKIDEPQLLAMLQAVVELKLSKNAMVKLLKRAAIIPLPKLIEHNAHNWLPSNASAALCLAAMKANSAGASGSSVKGKHEVNRTSDNGRCSCGCSQWSLNLSCLYCGQLLCQKRANEECESAPKIAMPSVSIQKCPIGEIDMNMLE